jgi:hypothetical protein
MDRFVVLSHPADPGNDGNLMRVITVEKESSYFLLTVEQGTQKTIIRLSRKATEELITGLDLLLGD